MPLIEVKVFEDELTQEQRSDLIQRITDAVTTVTSPKLRAVTWVCYPGGEER
jgi:phenylpyruvate tautomerase PptA (4-oxalocrotonate tautomerase family)